MMDAVKLVEIMLDPTKLFDFLAYSGEVHSKGEKIIVEQSSEMQDWNYCFQINNW